MPRSGAPRWSVRCTDPPDDDARGALMVKQRQLDMLDDDGSTDDEPDEEVPELDGDPTFTDEPEPVRSDDRPRPHLPWLDDAPSIAAIAGSPRQSRIAAATLAAAI